MGTFSFKWTKSHIKYLGVLLIFSLGRIFGLNVSPFLQKISSQLRQWSDRMLSWFCRNNILKINILPCLLYLLQMLPVKIQLSFLKLVMQEFMQFIFSAKSQRLNKDLIALPKDYVRLEFPDPWNTMVRSTWLEWWNGVPFASKTGRNLKDDPNYRILLSSFGTCFNCGTSSKRQWVTWICSPNHSHSITSVMRGGQ